jgi:hypothetical protein
MRWFENPQSPEVLQTSAKIERQDSRPPIAARAGEAIRMVVPELIECCAIGALAYGCHLAWRPLGFIVPGASLFGLSVFADFRSSSATKSARRGKQ